MVLQARVFWDAAGGAGGQTALHFGDANTPADVNAAVQAFFTAIRPALCNSTSASIDTVIRRYNVMSGELEEELNNPGTANIVGNGGISAVPNAAQGLIRLRTGTVVNGRVLKGRIYIPGMTSSAMTADGEVTSTMVTTLVGAGVALISATAPVNVWHRPVNGVGGIATLATGTSAWGEFAVQRRRRG